jgi:hypothetical protein
VPTGDCFECVACATGQRVAARLDGAALPPRAKGTQPTKGPTTMPRTKPRPETPAAPTPDEPATRVRPATRVEPATPVPAPPRVPAAPASDDGITFEFVEVTPALAREWLELNEDNRPISQPRVDVYARDMRAGAWQATHQGLAFDAAGKLADGQHRLWAVVEADVAVRMCVARGVAAGARVAMDQGRARTPADALRIVDHVKHGARLVSWFRVIASLEAGKPVQVSHATVRAQMARYAATVAWCTAHGPKTRPLNRVPVVGALVYAHRVAPAPVEAFAAAYVSGAGLAEGAPALVLRNFVLERVQQVRETEAAIALKTLRALHAHVAGEAIEKLFAAKDALEYFRALHAARDREAP